MSTMSKQHQFLGLLGWVVISFAASAIGAFATIQAKEFYGTLVQPTWSPPSWLFGPVWTLLYTCMAIAAFLVWRTGGFKANRVGLSLFVVQLAINALWSWLFFAWQLGGAAFGEIFLLWALILATIVQFWRVKPLAGALLIPYLLWVSFAAALNFALWKSNPGILG